MSKHKNNVRLNMIFNPVEDNIIATNVNYIPASTEHNFACFSVTNSHKSKLIKSWELV